jgi:hypothetical protein
VTRTCRRCSSPLDLYSIRATDIFPGGRLNSLFKLLKIWNLLNLVSIYSIRKLGRRIGSSGFKVISNGAGL